MNNQQFRSLLLAATPTTTKHTQINAEHVDVAPVAPLSTTHKVETAADRAAKYKAKLIAKRSGNSSVPSPFSSLPSVKSWQLHQQKQKQNHQKTTVDASVSSTSSQSQSAQVSERIVSATSPLSCKLSQP